MIPRHPQAKRDEHCRLLMRLCFILSCIQEALRGTKYFPHTHVFTYNVWSVICTSCLTRGTAVWCSLTAELLSMLVAVLPLEEAQKASKAKHSAKHGSAPSPAQAAAVAAAARAAGTQSSLSKEMFRLGEPCLSVNSKQTWMRRRGPPISYLSEVTVYMKASWLNSHQYMAVPS